MSTSSTKTYRVTASLVYRGALGGNTSEFLIDAKTAADAIKQARREMRRDGHTRQDGPVEYRATRSDA